MIQAYPLSELPAGSLCIATEKMNVRIEDSQEEVEQIYLTLQGTPDGFRWLANHLHSLATSVESNTTASGNVVAPRNFSNQPIELEGWDSLDFSCRR